MPLITPLSDYTDKDFQSLRLRLRNLIRSVFPEWTDFNVADFGNILIELFAHTGDVLTFYQDNQARQAHLPTATQRKAILGLVKAIGFVPSTAQPASADLTITLDTPPVGSVTFPKGTFVRTAETTNPTRYQLLEAVTIAANASPAVVSAAAENSETRSQSFLSSGLPNQEVALGSIPYIDGSAVIVANNGAFTQVDNFLDSTPTDRHFTVTVDQNDRATIRFGNGVNGTIPVGTYDVEYKTGGGVAGRVDPNKLVVFEQQTWADSLGNSVTPTVTNIEKSSGGTDRQTVAQIKERGPAALRALTRSVVREDFQLHALRLPEVARALMLTSDEDPSIAENSGDLYIIPVDGGLPSSELKSRVLAKVTSEYPQPVTFRVTVRDPVYKTVNISMIAYFQAGAVKANVAALIKSSLSVFFTPLNADGTTNTRVNFGADIRDAGGNVISELPLSDIFNVARDVVGVRKLPLNDFMIDGAGLDVLLQRKEFPRLGAVSITDGDTGMVY